MLSEAVARKRAASRTGSLASNDTEESVSYGPGQHPNSKQAYAVMMRRKEAAERNEWLADTPDDSKNFTPSGFLPDQLSYGSRVHYKSLAPGVDPAIARTVFEAAVKAIKLYCSELKERYRYAQDMGRKFKRHCVSISELCNMIIDEHYASKADCDACGIENFRNIVAKAAAPYTEQYYRLFDVYRDDEPSEDCETLKESIIKDIKKLVAHNKKRARLVKENKKRLRRALLREGQRRMSNKKRSNRRLISEMASLRSNL